MAQTEAQRVSRSGDPLSHVEMLGAPGSRPYSEYSARGRASAPPSLTPRPLLPALGLPFLPIPVVS